MAWEGWFSYAGNEIINTTRTETYVRNAKINWFRPQFENDSLPHVLGDRPYLTPLLDDAPWTDPDVPESYDFYGLYPLGVEGIENSTRSSTTTESLGDGGIPGRLRHGTKTVVFSCVLIAGTEAAADYALTWLRQVLSGGVCGPSTASACFGETLCFLSSPPEVDLSASVQPDSTYLDGGTASVEVDTPLIDGGSAQQGLLTTIEGALGSQRGISSVEECLTPLLRSLRKVLVNNGPTVTSKRTTRDGGAVWQVQFTAVAGDPHIFGAEIPVIEGLLDAERLVPWVGDTEPLGGFIDIVGNAVIEPDCTVPTSRPITDPLHPALIPPPGPPSIPLGNFTPPSSWWRRMFSIPKQYVPLWGEVMPRLAIHARDDDLRNLRLRFYADPYKVGDISDDPCAYCGDIIISYVPMDHTLIFDSADQRVYVTRAGGGEQRADSLVFKSDGTPFEWPALTCGFGYVVTLDLPKEQTPPVVDLSLFARTA
jgi:hypothetical protein